MEQVPQQIGPYRVAEEIGRGRLTVVYRAMDTLYERVVALKVLPVYFAHDPALVRHFVSEGREAMRLQHPGVIQVYDAGQADGFTYLAQEWMSGGTLGEFLATQQGRLPHETVIAIVEQIAAGLDYAHHQGYIHRNLNPRNILFGERGQVKIADFSRGAPPRNTLFNNQLSGSPAFMAPEQARGDENLTAQADIYSLGVITYRLLAGRLPFEADNPLVLLRKIIEDPPPLVENFNPDVQFGAAYAVHQALTKQPALRQSTAAAFAYALTQGKVTTLASAAPARDEQPSSEPPPPALPVSSSATALALSTPLVSASAPARTKPPISKNQRTLALVGGLVTTALVILFIFALAQSRTTLLDRLLNGPEATSLPVAVFVVQTATETPALKLDLAQNKVAPAVILASDGLVSNTPPAVTTAIPTVVLLAAATESTVANLEADAPATSAALLATAQSILNRLGSTTPTPVPTPDPVIPVSAASPVLDLLVARPGLVTDFESGEAWLYDEEPWGTFSTSNEQVYGGVLAGKFVYAFPANAFNNRNYLAVWRTLPLSSDQAERDPNALTLWVYGDGSGSFLNAWITDAVGQDWQFTFGQINHIGWEQMTASFDLSSGWPNQPLGANTGVNPIIYPVNLSALVLDGYPDDIEHTGIVYVDDLAATTLASTAPDSSLAAASEAAPVAPTQLPVSSSPTGRIAYAAADPHSTRFDLYFYNLESKVSWPKLPGRRQPDFSPQGNVVANSEEGDLNNLILMGPLGEDPRVISAHPEDGRSHWAITGKTLVFESTYEGDRRQRLYLQEDTNYGATVSPLRYDAWEIFGRYPVFLNDGRIVYNGCDIWENGSVCGVYLVDTSGGKPVGVTDWPGDLPSDNLGSQVLATSSRGGNWDVYLVNPTDGAVQRLTDSPAHDGLATASPDGNYIAFVSDRDGAWGVYTMRTDGSEQQKLFEIEFGYGSGDHDWLEERLSWGW